jgi:hypothetical protein
MTLLPIKLIAGKIPVNDFPTKRIEGETAAYTQKAI